jgi:2-polyprenyl-3-methyl-5-hydroxy-6-metoxy-1,4-benzoquinol methylase
MTIERIPEDSWRGWDGHIYRYQLAAGWLVEGEKVYDVACGIGYGAEVIAETKKVDYLGIDKIQSSGTFAAHGRFLGGVNLDEWVADEAWDVTITFETLEHVQNPVRLAKELAKASRLVVCSVPTRPTKHMNEHHLHDFTVNDVLEMFAGCELLHIEDQPAELSHIFVFKTR